MFEIKNLTKSYNKEVKAIENINFYVKDGEIYGFLGANGAGKTTTINCITGLLKPDRGESFIDGISLIKDPINYKKRIGYVPDFSQSYERITGRQYIIHINKIFNNNDISEDLNKWVNLFDIEKAIDEPIKTYSHGMKQKFYTICAIIHKPKIWIMDEPMTGLDPKSTIELTKYMREFVKDGSSILFSSHIIDIILMVCDRVGVIKNGILVKEYNIEELKNNLDDLDSILK